MAGRVAALLACLWLVPHGASAVQWRVDDALSVIEFDYVVNGAAGVGVFPAFAGSGRFDAAAPGESSLELVIETGALELGTMIGTAFARSEGWFDTEAHPDANFRLARLTPLPDGRWRAEGTLSLRGIDRPLTADLTLDLGPDRARAVGETTIDRTEFDIGRGPTAVLVAVDHLITVRFDLVAVAAPAE